jgi:hypothetical protein
MAGGCCARSRRKARRRCGSCGCPLYGEHKPRPFDVGSDRQLTGDCFKSRGDSIEFTAAIRKGLAERPNSFISFSYHSCFSLGYRSMNTKLALSALVAALMLTACAKQEAASPDTAAAPPATTEAAPAAPAAADAPAAPAADAPAAAPADGTAAPPPADAPAAPPKQ